MNADMPTLSRFKLVSAAIAIVMLAACGGGGGSAPTNTLSLAGVAATGAAVAGGQVEAKCATGNSATTTATDGTFTLTSTRHATHNSVSAIRLMIRRAVCAIDASLASARSEPAVRSV